MIEHQSTGHTPAGHESVNMVKDIMFNVKARRKTLGISSNTEALVIERRGRSKSKKPSNDYNRDKSREKSKSRK